MWKDLKEELREATEQFFMDTPDFYQGCYAEDMWAEYSDKDKFVIFEQNQKVIMEYLKRINNG